MSNYDIINSVGVKENMKKIFAVILLILVVISAVVVIKFQNIQKEKKEIAKFNLEYEEYNKENLNGLDITTVINKAVNNNEKYNITKDENGLYVQDDDYSIQIYITMIINGKTYPMEKINALGINSFIEYFGVVGFKCTDIQYHEHSGRIASMTFEATDY